MPSACALTNGNIDPNAIANPCCTAFVANQILKITCLGCNPDLTWVGPPLRAAPPFCNGQWTAPQCYYEGPPPPAQTYSDFASEVCWGINSFGNNTFVPPLPDPSVCKKGKKKGKKGKKGKKDKKDKK